MIVEKGHGFIGHMFSNGFPVIDVRDPLNPKTIAFVTAPKNTRSRHLQVHGDILLAVNGPNVWAMQQYQSQQAYYAKSLADSMTTEQPFAAGLRVFDISNRRPRARSPFSTCPASAPIVSGGSAAAMPMSRCISRASSITCLPIIDVSDPAKPTLAGRWWLPGMHRAGGETPPASFGKRTALHHLIAAGNLGFAAWRDGGLTVHDLSDPVHPKLIAHRNTAPPFAGGAHPPLPLPDRNLVVLADEATSVNCANGLAYTWIYDVRAPDNPVTIATLPTPTGEDFCAKGGNSVRTICTKTGRARCNAPISSSPPTTMPACVCSTSPTSLRRRKSLITCRRRPNASSTSDRTRPKSSSPATCLSTRTA